MTDTEEAALVILAQSINDAICDRIEEGCMESRELAARVVTTKTVRDAFLRVTAPAAVPDDVARLVVAARIVAFEDQSKEALRELDVASEAFASRVPWSDEPKLETAAVSQGNGD